MNTTVAIPVETLQPCVPPYGRWHVRAEEWDALQAERAYKRDMDNPSAELDKMA